MQSIAVVLKANPYHDALGRFATKDSHTFRSIGPKFQKSTERAKESYAGMLRGRLESFGITTASTNISELSRQLRAAKKPPAPSAPPARPLTAAQRRAAEREARAAVAAERETRKQAMIAHRLALVKRSAQFNPQDLVRLENTTDARLAAIEAEIAAGGRPYGYSLSYLRRRVDRIKHAKALAEAGLTPFSTEATARNVTSAMLDFKGGFGPEFAAHIARQRRESAARTQESAQARREALGARLAAMSQEERRAWGSDPSRSLTEIRMAGAAMAEHLSRRVRELSNLTHEQRQRALSEMSPAEANRIQNSVDYYTRRRWNEAQRTHDETVARAAMGGVSAQELFDANQTTFDQHYSVSSPEQRAAIDKYLAAYAAARGARLAASTASQREDELRVMDPRQEALIRQHMAPAVRASIEAEDRQYAEQQRRREQERQDRLALERATVETLSPSARTVYDSVNALIKEGVTVNTGVSSSAVHVAMMFDRHYPGVTPSNIVDAILGPGAAKRSGRVSISDAGDVTVTFGSGSTVYGSEVAVSVQRSFYKRSGNVHHDYQKLKASSRGGGSVKQQFAASIPLYQKMGMKTFDVYAALENGGYVWARYGFDARRGDTTFYNNARTSVENMASRMSSQIASSPAAQAELATLRKVVEAHKTNQALPSIFTAVHTPALDALTAQHGFGSQGDKSKFLSSAMQNTSWQGEFDMRSERQIKTLSKYIGTDLPVLVDSTASAPVGTTVRTV